MIQRSNKIRNINVIICNFTVATPGLIRKNIFTSLGFFPGGLALLKNNFFLYLGFFIELIEVIDDDGDWKGDAENSTESAAYDEKYVSPRVSAG